MDSAQIFPVLVLSDEKKPKGGKKNLVCQWYDTLSLCHSAILGTLHQASQGDDIL